MGNSPSQIQGSTFLYKLSQDTIDESNEHFWFSLFTTISPDTVLPDLSQLIINQKANVTTICEKCMILLENLWLSVVELDEFLIRSAENSLNFLSGIIPGTIEYHLHDYFWDSSMRGYRIIKAACGLYTTPGFGSGHSSVPLSISTILVKPELSPEHFKHKELILQLLVSCILNKSLSWKMLISLGIIKCEDFLIGLLNSLTVNAPITSATLVKNVLSLIKMLIQVEYDGGDKEQDMELIRSLMYERKALEKNVVKEFFSKLSDENANRILSLMANVAGMMENNDAIQSVLCFMSSLLFLNPIFARSIAVSRHISIATSILRSKSNINIRFSGSSFATFFYFLSWNREFSVSLSSSEMNSLVQLLCRVILFPEYEFQEYFPYLLGSLCNISSYFLEIFPESAIFIVSVYEYLADKSWLLSKKQNHLNVFYYIQALNNIIQYQWEGAGYLLYHIIKRKESFYKIIRMQVNTPDEPCLDDKDTDGELDEDSAEDYKESNSDNEEEEKKHESGPNSEANEEKHSLHNRTPRESEEIYSEEEDRVIELERISEGLILGLNAGGPDEVVQRTSYLNTHVSTFSEDIDRRNTVQHIEIMQIKDEEWKPTPEWMLVWKSKLPMKCIFVVIKELFSTVLEMQEENKKLEEIVEKIRNSTLVGLLPRPHPIYLVTGFNKET